MSAMATPVALPVPGSKSVTHRAFLLGALSSVPCRVEAPLMGADCKSTLAVLRGLGARFTVAAATTSRCGSTFTSNRSLNCNTAAMPLLPARNHA